MFDAAKDAAKGLVNGRGRSSAHIAAGLALCAGAVLASALIARRNAPTDDNPQIKAQYDRLRRPAIEPPRRTFALVWPPLFLMLTLSGVRVWNASDSLARSRALGLWGAVQGLNALWMALGPRRLPAQVATAAASLAASLAYAREAGKVDKTAAGLVAPFLGWIGLASVLTAELFRLNQDGGRAVVTFGDGVQGEAPAASGLAPYRRGAGGKPSSARISHRPF